MFPAVVVFDAAPSTPGIVAMSALKSRRVGTFSTRSSVVVKPSFALVGSIVGELPTTVTDSASDARFSWTFALVDWPALTISPSRTTL